jgi:outer membrane protein assembly factor BamB
MNRMHSDWMIALGLLSATGGWGPYELSPTPPATFDAPPVEQWTVPLPAPILSSATHTELGSPVIHGEEIFIGSAALDALIVLDRRDGRLLRMLPAAGPVQSAPVIFDGRVYFSDSSGTTWCYPLSGDVPFWSHYSGAPILSSPTVTGDRVYLANVDNLVYALQRSDGELAWRYAHRTDPTRTAELELYGAPSPILSGDAVLTGFSDGAFIALSASSGDPLWSRRVGEGAYPDIIAAALTHGDEIIVSGYSEPLLAMDRVTQSVRWRMEVGGAQSPHVDDGRLIHGGGDGILRALDGQTGDLLWEWDSETGGALTRPIDTEAGLLIGASGGSVYLVSDDGELLWTYDPGFFLAGVTANPVVEGRQALVLTNAGNLISFVVPDAGPGRKPMVERPPRGPR